MMNFAQVTEKISSRGYRRSTSPYEFWDERNYRKVYDFNHKRKDDVFSVYLDEFNSVVYIEFTKVSFDHEARRFTQQTTKINNINELNKVLAHDLL